MVGLAGRKETRELRASSRRELALYPAPSYGLAALLNDLDERPLLAAYGEPDRTEPVRELLAMAPGRIISWQIEASRVLDLAPVNDMEMVGRHRFSNGRMLIQFRQAAATPTNSITAVPRWS
jgi:hypothetical protein